MSEVEGVFRRTRAGHPHENAQAELKALMPEDAKEAIGYGILREAQNPVRSASTSL